MNGRGNEWIVMPILLGPLNLAMYRIKQDLRGEQMCLDENGRQDGSSRKSQKEWEKYSLKIHQKEIISHQCGSKFLKKMFQMSEMHFWWMTVVMTRARKYKATVIENDKKLSSNIASEASNIYVFSGQKLKMTTMVHFDEFLKTCSLRLNSATK